MNSITPAPENKLTTPLGRSNNDNNIFTRGFTHDLQMSTGKVITTNLAEMLGLRKLVKKQKLKDELES